MGILANLKGFIAAALLTIAAAPASGQSPPVLTGAAAYGDWQGDAPGVRRKITPADMPPPYATASAHRGPTVVARPAARGRRRHPALPSSSWRAASTTRA